MSFRILLVNKAFVCLVFGEALLFTPGILLNLLGWLIVAVYLFFIAGSGYLPLKEKPLGQAN